MKPLIILAFMCTLSSCVYKTYTTKIENPKIRTPNIPERYLSFIDCSAGTECKASIGDTIFVINRYITANQEKISAASPTSQKFPEDAAWAATYLYNDGSSGDLKVFTNPNYHGGSIGVILDDNEKIATSEPLVQVNGRKEGRRWNINQRGDFFIIPSTNIDSWALRYGGTKDKNFIFEIVKGNESKVTEILQTISVTEEEFSQGITVRDVKITGKKTQEFGVIQYKATDTLTK